MKAYFGPWLFSQRLHSWVPPEGASCLLDLSPLCESGREGLFLAPFLPLDWREVADPFAFAWDTLTAKAAVDGSTSCPLVPTVDLSLELHLGVFGSRCEPFEWGKHPHTSRMRDLLRGHFRDHWQHDREHARRYLDWTREKYRLTGEHDWCELVPADLLPHVEGPLPHTTLIHDDFNRTDQANLESANATFGGVDQGWSWADYNVFALTSNQAVFPGGAGQSAARAQSDLSGSDHYSLATIVATGNTDAGAGVAARFDSAAQTHYATGPYSDGNCYLRKVVAGSSTLLKTVTLTQSLPEAYKLQCSGSTLTTYQAGTLRDTTTDTAIAGNTRCGLWCFKGGTTNPTWDDFEAADLSVGGASPPVAAWASQAQIIGGGLY